MSAPERIKFDPVMFLVNPDYEDEDVVEYIRYDIYAELEKDLAVANELLDHYRSGAH